MTRGAQGVRRAASTPRHRAPATLPWRQGPPSRPGGGARDVRCRRLRRVGLGARSSCAEECGRDRGGGPCSMRDDGVEGKFILPHPSGGRKRTARPAGKGCISATMTHAGHTLYPCPRALSLPAARAASEQRCSVRACGRSARTSRRRSEDVPPGKCSLVLHAHIESGSRISES